MSTPSQADPVVPGGLANSALHATAYVALGSNLDQPEQHVQRAFEQLRQIPHSRLMRHSRLYRSPPAGYAGQPDFINAVAELRTQLAPAELLAALLDIETRHGRKRLFRNAPRTLDLDLLLYDDVTLHAPGLSLPHPRMHERPFVLIPLLEIAPSLQLPDRGAIKHLLHSHDRSRVVALPNTGTSGAAA